LRFASDGLDIEIPVKSDVDDRLLDSFYWDAITPIPKNVIGGKCNLFLRVYSNDKCISEGLGFDAELPRGPQRVE
jgi:hypothetical protein